MKKLFLALVLLILCPGLVFATANVTFIWDANTEPDLAGYRLYQSQISGSYTYGSGNEIIDVPVGMGVTTTTISVADGTYFWVLTAYDTEGNESGPSNEVTATIETVPPAAPTGLIITEIIPI